MGLLFSLLMPEKRVFTLEAHPGYSFLVRPSVSTQLKPGFRLSLRVLSWGHLHQKHSNLSVRMLTN